VGDRFVAIGAGRAAITSRVIQPDIRLTERKIATCVKGANPGTSGMVSRGNAEPFTKRVDVEQHVGAPAISSDGGFPRIVGLGPSSERRA